MLEDTRKGMGLWILAGLLVLAIVGLGIWGMVRLSGLEYAPGWYATMENVTVEPMQLEEGDEDCEYYRLRFSLTNNSDQEIYLEDWQLDVRPVKGERYAADVWDRWLEDVTLESEPCVPVGCTGQADLIVEVDRERMTGKKLKITLDPYGQTPLELGEVDLP